MVKLFIEFLISQTLFWQKKSEIYEYCLSRMHGLLKTILKINIYIIKRFSQKERKNKTFNGIKTNFIAKEKEKH